MNWNKIFDNWNNYSSSTQHAAQIIFWVVIGIIGVVAALSIGLIGLWIHYSWVRKENSKNYTGRDISEFILRKSGMGNTQIESSVFYLKYWNYNARRGTFKLRPWTYSRRSIWTMMEASQQAYASSIRYTKGATFWAIFRLPAIIRIAGLIAAVVLFIISVKNVDGIDGMKTSNWFGVGVACTIFVISYTVAEVGKIFVIWKNVRKVIADSGLNEQELKAINRIYFWRLVYAIVLVILEIIKLVLQILLRANDKKNN